MKTTLYPKTYATVVRRTPDDRHVTVRTDAGIEHDLDLRHRNGYGWTDSFVRGTRVKMYRRPGRNHWNFRKVGS